MRKVTILLAIGALLAVPAAGHARSNNAAGSCSNGKSTDAAMWYSVAHPGLGEWYLRDWGSFNAHAPQKKFWLGFIPVYGWPGYLQVKSAIDARHCRTNDDLANQHVTHQAHN